APRWICPLMSVPLISNRSPDCAQRNPGPVAPAGQTPDVAGAPSGLPLHDAVAQHADPFDLELDHVARLEETHVLEAAPVADGSRAEELARVKGLGPRHVGDAVLELPSHLARIAPPPFFAVHPRDHCEPVRVAELVGRDEARPHGIAAVKILA